jgi:hypothetical protein
VFVAEGGEQRPQPLAVGVVEALVGVEPEDPVTGGVAQAGVAGGGEVVAPGEVEEAGAEAGGHLAGVVSRAGVHDDDFLDEVGGAGQRGGQAGGFVADDQAERDASGHGGSVLETRCYQPMIQPHLLTPPRSLVPTGQPRRGTTIRRPRLGSGTVQRFLPSR